MTDQDHVELLKVLKAHSGKVILSGYENEIYNNLLKGWYTAQKTAQVEGGRNKIETIWMNYEPSFKQISFL